MSHFVKSMEAYTATKCLLFLHLHMDDKLIALRPGHSSLELCLCSMGTCLLTEYHKGAECQKGAPLQVPDERHFWFSEPLLISMNKTLCVGGLFFPPHKQCCNHLTLLKIPKDCLVQSTISLLAPGN